VGGESSTPKNRGLRAISSKRNSPNCIDRLTLLRSELADGVHDQHGLLYSGREPSG